MISLSQTFQDDAAEMKGILTMFSSVDRKTEKSLRDAEIMNVGRRKTGAELAVRGAEQAADHADEMAPGWREMALQAVRDFVKHHHGVFQAEDVRTWARHIPPVPSERAWGSVMLRASRLGLIINTGETRKVKNATAHSANASVWRMA